MSKKNKCPSDFKRQKTWSINLSHDMINKFSASMAHMAVEKLEKHVQDYSGGGRVFSFDILPL